MMASSGGTISGSVAGRLWVVVGVEEGVEVRLLGRDLVLGVGLGTALP
jgi:hypothetical protein